MPKPHEDDVSFDNASQNLHEMIRTVLDSVLRQEVIMGSLVEEYTSRCSQERQHFASISEKLDSIQAFQNNSATSVEAPLNGPADSSIPMLDGRQPDIVPEHENGVGQDGIKSDADAEGANKNTSTQLEVSTIECETASTENKTEYAEPPPLTRLQGLVSSPKFEIAMSCVIVLNMCILCLKLQSKGNDVAHELGLQRFSPFWSGVATPLMIADKFCNIVYLLELVARIYTYRIDFFRHAFNLVDASIVIITFAEGVFSLVVHNDSGNSVSMLRLARVFRIFRFSRIFRYTERWAAMGLLVRTLVTCFRCVAAAAVLLAGVVIATAVFVVQLAIDKMDDESVGFERRKWLFQYFGTTTRGAYTIFECTFTSTWTTISRPMIEEIGTAWGVFWVLYILVVNFAAMRVIAALFLKQTMDSAEVEAERRALENLKRRRAMSHEILALFKAVDTSGDGAISKKEFEVMLRKPKVMANFRELDLDEDEVEALFNVCAAEDGLADYNEFLEGALKMKTNARTIDAVQILHKQMDLRKLIVEVKEIIEARAGGTMGLSS